MKVILVRGEKGNREWDEADKAKALSRADALCDLHSCGMTIEEDRIIVHASEYYDPNGK
jgi:hypothetical protein